MGGSNVCKQVWNNDWGEMYASIEGQRLGQLYASKDGIRMGMYMLVQAGLKL